MARAQDQKRWRERSGKKPVQVYLHAETLAQLDALAAEREQSRAEIIADLIGEAAPAAAPAESQDDDTRDMFDAEGQFPDGKQDAPAAEAAQEPASEPKPEPERSGKGGGIEGLSYQRKAAGEYAVYYHGDCVGRVWKWGSKWRAAASDSTLWEEARGRQAAVVAMLAAQGYG